MEANPIILGTRGSELARWQANRVKDALEECGHRVALQEITTRGDQVQDVPLSQIGDEAVFTKELDRALLRGDIHCAVHSLKDLPSRLPDGIELAAVSKRAVPFDAFIARPSFDGKLDDLPEGGVIATSSLRRKAQLNAWRPDLQVVPIRGNVDTRLEKLDASDWHGMVLAVAGLVRMGLNDRIRQSIPPEIMIPAVGQGALGVTCRGDDAGMRALLHQTIHHRPTGIAAIAERAFLRRIGGGCKVPVGAWGRLNADGQLVLDGCIAALDGSELYRKQVVIAPEEAKATGSALATDLMEQGGAAIVENILNAR